MPNGSNWLEILPLKFWVSYSNLTIALKCEARSYNQYRSYFCMRRKRFTHIILIIIRLPKYTCRRYNYMSPLMYICRHIKNRHILAIKTNTHKCCRLFDNKYVRELPKWQIIHTWIYRYYIYCGEQLW